MTWPAIVTGYLGEGTHAARPATPPIPSGGIAIYYETDTTSTFLWDGAGAAWVALGGGGGGGGLFSQVLSTLPTQAGTGLSTSENLGTASKSDSATGVTINSPSKASLTVSGVKKTAPATPYTITGLVALTSVPGNNVIAGLAWISTGGKVYTHGLFLSSVSEVLDSKWSDANTFVGNLIAVGAPAYANGLVWLRLVNDGTNVTMSYSTDGANFMTSFTETIAGSYMDDFANVCFFVSADGSPAIGTLMSYKQTSP